MTRIKEYPRYITLDEGDIKMTMAFIIIPAAFIALLFIFFQLIKKARLRGYKNGGR